ncbi:coiled-coil domain-containing protein 78 [Neosynchiropus ocellatus]
MDTPDCQTSDQKQVQALAGENVSKELLEEKLQFNQVTMQLEKEMFDLKEKVINQSSVTSDLQMERDRLLQELQSAQACVQAGEEGGNNLKDELTALKNSFLALSEAHDTEVKHNEELSSELLTLASAQDTLHRQLQEQHEHVYTTSRTLHGELERVQTLISRMSHDRLKPEALAAISSEQKDMEKHIIGNQDEIRRVLGEMKNSYEERLKKLMERVEALSNEHKDDKPEIHNREPKLSEQSKTLLSTQSTVEELEAENSNLQLRLKHLNEEYRTRLVRYLRDVAEVIDNRGKTWSGTRFMKEFVDRVLQDIRSTYRVREEQLASAASLYKKTLNKITKAYQDLLVAHSVQRDTFKSSAGHGPSDLQPQLSEEVPQDKVQEVAVLPAPPVSCPEATKLTQTCEASCVDVRRQLKLISSEESFEKERAALITRATLAEAKVFELQKCRDNQPARSATCLIV